MATETVEKLISKEAIESFITLKGLVNDNVEAFEKLIATGVKLNNDLGKSNTFSQINKGAAELSANEQELTKQVAELQKANERLNKLYEDQGKKIDALLEKKKKYNEDEIKKTEALAAKQKKADDEAIKRAEAKNAKTKKDSSGNVDTDKVAKAQEGLNNLYSAEARELAVILEQKKLVNAGNRQTAKETLGLIDAYTALEQKYKAAAREAQNLIITKGADNEETKEAVARAQELDRQLKSVDAAIGRFNRNVGNYSGALQVLEKGLQDVKKKMDDYAKSGKADAAVIEQLQKEEALLTKLLASQEAGFAKATQEIKANTVALQEMAAAGLEGTEAYNLLFKATADLKDQTADLAESLKNAAPDDVAFNAAADAARGLIGLYGLAASATAAFGVKNEAFEETLVKLQAAETALQSIEAIRTLFKKESAFQQAIVIGLQKIEILQTNLQTAAESKNIIVRYAAIAAQKALNAVMALAGGPMLLILGLLALLVISLSSFSSASEKARKDFESLNNAFEKSEILLNDRVEAIKQASEIEIAELEQTFASEQKIRTARLKALNDELSEIKGFAAENAENYRDAYDLSRVLQIKLKQEGELDKADEKALQNSTEFVNKYVANSKRRADIETQITVTLANNRKADTEERIKAAQIQIENERTLAADRKAIAEKDADDQTKIFDERIKAQEKANQIQEDLINKQAKSQRLTPGQTPSELKQIEVQRITAIAEARREGNKKLEDLRKEQVVRERQAQFEIAKLGIELQAEAAQELANNQNKSLEDRLFAQYEYFKAQETLVIGNKYQELSTATLTATERKAIEEKANADILRLRTQFLKDTNAIQLQALDDQNADSVSRFNEETSRNIIALNERFEAGKISARKYNQDRAQLEKAATFESLDLQLENLKKVADAYVQQGIDITQIQEEIADVEKRISDEKTKKQLEDIEKVRAAQEQLGMEIFGLFSDLVVAGYEKEKNAIQEQMDLNEEKKARDIATVQQTVTDKQKQADEIAIIEAKATADREALERRQRQLDVQKAKFEKAQTIAKIILDTARGVIAALTSTPPNVPLSIYVGAIGAVSLARAIATPVPAYKHGTDSAEGGTSLVGDGYVREWGLTPAGKVFSTPNRPTLMNVEKGTKIFANDQKALEAGIFDDLHKSPVLSGTDTSYRYMTEKLGGKLDNVVTEIKRGNKIRRRREKTGWQTIKKQNIA